MSIVFSDTDTANMLGVNVAEREEHRNTIQLKSRTTIRFMVVFFIDFITSGDYINFIHIKE